MYFIVYICQTSRYVVVPYTWIQLNNFMEWMVNNGINSNITFEVFYTENPDAFENEVPRINFAPNVHASSESQFPNEGWYTCFIRRFHSMYYFKYTLRKNTSQSHTACGLKTGKMKFWIVIHSVCFWAKFDLRFEQTQLVLLIFRFVCTLVNIEEAFAYKIRRRNYPPGLYNARRLHAKKVKPRAGQNVSDFFQLQLASGKLNENICILLVFDHHPCTIQLVI